MSELMFSKQKQISGKKELSDREKDKRFRACFMVLVNHFYKNYSEDISVDFCSGRLFYVEQLHVDHIDHKASANRWSFSNVQLLSGKSHRDKHDTGKHTDYRTDAFKRFIKQFDFNEREEL